MDEIRKSVMISPEIHKILKIEAAKTEKTIKTMVCEILKKELEKKGELVEQKHTH